MQKTLTVWVGFANCCEHKEYRVYSLEYKDSQQKQEVYRGKIFHPLIKEKSTLR